MMPPTSRFSSLDQTIAAIRNEFEQENQTLKDDLTAAKIEVDICKAKMSDALRERDVYLRLATKLVTQFATVEQVFADAKRIAIEHAMLEAKESQEPSRSESANASSEGHPPQSDDPNLPSNKAEIASALAALKGEGEPHQ